MVQLERKEYISLANHKSEIKRARQNQKRNLRNKSMKTRIKNSLKSVRSAIEEKSKESAQTAFTLAKSILHKASQKGVIHDRTASRKISRLSRAINNMA